VVNHLDNYKFRLTRRGTTVYRWIE
jgi:hypothetical protein